MLGGKRCLDVKVAINSYPQWPQEGILVCCICALVMLVNRVHSNLHLLSLTLSSLR